MNLKQKFTTEGIFNALLHIHRNNGETYQAKMVRQLDSATPMISSYLTYFSQHDLIEKEEGNTKKWLSLTDKGSELAREFERLDRVFEEVESQ